MSTEQPEMTAPEDPEPGWYDYAGGLRLWDGERWTNHFAPPPPSKVQSFDFWEAAKAVAAGMVLGWFLIWIGAQFAPDVFYWPIKVVVEDLPEGF